MSTTPDASSTSTLTQNFDLRGWAQGCLGRLMVFLDFGLRNILIILLDFAVTALIKFNYDPFLIRRFLAEGDFENVRFFYTDLDVGLLAENADFYLSILFILIFAGFFINGVWFLGKLSQKLANFMTAEDVKSASSNKKDDNQQEKAIKTLSDSDSSEAPYQMKEDKDDKPRKDGRQT